VNRVTDQWLAQARENLRQARAYQPTDPRDTAARDRAIAQIEAFIRANEDTGRGGAA